MATLYSAQTQRSAAASQNYTLRSGLNEVNSVKSVCYFSRNMTDATNGTVGNGDIILVARLPKGARILGGVLKTSALGADVDALVGILGTKTGTAVDDNDEFLGTTDVAAISSTPFAATVALGYGLELTEECWLTVTLTGAVPAGVGNISGHVEYLVN